MLLVYFAFWILLNARWSWDVAVTGVFVCGLVYLFTYKVVGLTPRREWRVVRRLAGYIGYFWYLVGAIFKANGQVLRILFTLDQEVEPRLVRVRTSLKEEVSQVLLANSITITPGTITVWQEGDELYVHALDRETAEGLEDSEFEKKLKRLEGEAK